jgi:hypothetical protein
MVSTPTHPLISPAKLAPLDLSRQLNATAAISAVLILTNLVKDAILVNQDHFRMLEPRSALAATPLRTRTGKLKVFALNALLDTSLERTNLAAPSFMRALTS